MRKVLLSLEEICKGLCPEAGEISWGDIWQRPLESGDSFEWTLFFSLASEARRLGLEVSFPLLQCESGKDLFCSWNKIPMHYVSKVGHSFSRDTRHILATKFCLALVPKMIISDGEHKYSIFREGCPYHTIMSEEDYNERPDILILDGNPIEDYPKVTEDDQYVHFKYQVTPSLLLSGCLRVINSSLLPIEEKSPDEDCKIPIRGIVECSTNKSEEVAAEQLKRYEGLFGNEHKLEMVLVTGNQCSLAKWPCFFIDLKAEKEHLRERIQEVGASILKSFSLV